MTKLNEMAEEFAKNNHPSGSFEMVAKAQFMIRESYKAGYLAALESIEVLAVEVESFLTNFNDQRNIVERAGMRTCSLRLEDFVALADALAAFRKMREGVG